MKTRLEHFKENLTPEELEKAIANSTEEQQQKKSRTAYTAVFHTFFEETTQEQFEENRKYWMPIYVRLVNQECFKHRKD